MGRDVDAEYQEGAPVPGEGEPDGDRPIYTPAPGELQLTLRAVVAGCLLGGLVAAMNIYFGLRTGWSVGGSLLAAILAYATFHVLRPRTAFTPLETNIAQTAGSAAGSMAMTAGLIAAIPALELLGRPLGYLELSLWAGAVAWLGVFFAVPLRRQMVLAEKLRFPTGTATAHTIVAMFGSGAETLRKARVLLFWALAAGAYTLLAFFVPDFESPPLHEWIAWAPLVTAAGYTFTVYVSPLLIGAGVLIGMRVSLSLVAGAILAWAVIAPAVESAGWVTGPTMSYATGARGWILWMGVGIMVADALTTLALSWRTVIDTFRPAVAGTEEDERLVEPIPNAWWMGGLALSTALTTLVAWQVFDIPPWQTVLAVALSWVLAAIATRSTGETDINPVSGVGKVTQLVYGGLAPAQPVVNLMAAGITGAGASQAADMMQDLKTGHLLGASPRKQFLAQLVGIVAGILLCVPIYLLVTHAYELGSEKLPAPSAFAWKAMAELLAEGFSALPSHAGIGVLAGVLFGIAVPVLRRTRPRLAPYLPSGLAFGIAFIIPAFYSLCFLYGAIAYALWRKRAPGSAQALGFAVASGLIAGEGLMGIVTAVLKLAGFGP